MASRRYLAMPATEGTTGARPRARRTQAERSAATQGRLLDATIQSLVEVGYANTTTTRIAELAGVSRGAQMHHYRSKADLVTAAVEHLADRRIDEIRSAADRLPRQTSNRAKAVLDLAWQSYKGPLFQAAVELWVAARTDEELRATLIPMEAKIAATVYELSAELFGEEIASTKNARRLMAMSLNSMQGLALGQTFQIESPAVDRMWAFTRDRLVKIFEEEMG